MKRIIYFLAALLSTPIISTAQTVNLQQVVTGLSSPIGAYFAPGNDTLMYVIQQGGRIRIANVNTGAILPNDFLNVTSKVISTGNEQGLLGLAFHPDYNTNGYFFINYTKSGNGATVVARYKRNSGNPLTADLISEDIVLTVSQPYSNHNGGQLQFGADGYLYIGMGDGGSGGDPNGNGQNTNTRLAKMLRVDIDVDSGYAIPPTNPFVVSSSTLPEIWSIGLRNPWRFSFDMATHDMWIADVGQESVEEIDVEPAHTGGLNYGWRCYEGNVEYNTSTNCNGTDYVAPAFTFSSAGGSGNCSVTGGFVYRGGTYGEFYGKYIFTDYCSGKFWFMYPNGSGGWATNIVTTAPSLTYQLSSFGQDGKGEMYVVSRDGNKIYRLTGTECAPAGIYSSTGSLTSCTGSLELIAPFGPNNTYAWYKDNVLQSETSNIFTATASGQYKVEVENTNTNCGNDTTVTVTINNTPPVVDFTLTLPVEAICLNDSIPFTATPAGGTFYGPGVVGNKLYTSLAGVGGPYTYSYTYSSGGCTVSDTAITDLFISNCYVGIAENEYNNLSVYPNPFTDVITIPLDGIKNITVYSADGKELFRNRQGENTVQLSFLAEGTYILKLEHNGQVYRRTIIKTK